MINTLISAKPKLMARPGLVDSEGQVAELTALSEDLLPPETRHVAATPDGSRLFGLRYTGNSGNSMYMWTTVRRDRRGRFLLVFSPGYVHRVDIAAATSARLPFPEGMPYHAAW